MKKRAFLALLLALALFLPACASLPRLVQNGEGYRNPKDGKQYVEAPLCYTAARRQDKAAATIERSGTEEELYPVGDFALCTASGELFLQKGTSLPTLSDFAPDALLLCVEDTRTVELSRSSDATLLAAILAAMEGRPFDEDLLIPSPRYVILLSSSAHPDLFYRLEYRVDDASAPGVLFDREQSLYVRAPAGLYELLTGEK